MKTGMGRVVLGVRPEKRIYDIQEVKFLFSPPQRLVIGKGADLITKIDFTSSFVSNITIFLLV